MYTLCFHFPFPPLRARRAEYPRSRRLLRRSAPRNDGRGGTRERAHCRWFVQSRANVRLWERLPKLLKVGGTFALLKGVEAERKNLKDELKKKLERIEALYQRPGSVGEKTAAAIAMNRLKGRIAVLETYAKRQAVPMKYEFTVFKEI